MKSILNPTKTARMTEAPEMTRNLASLIPQAPGRRVTVVPRKRDDWQIPVRKNSAERTDGFTASNISGGTENLTDPWEQYRAWQAIDSLNREIASNKIGYLAVPEMSFADFLKARQYNLGDQYREAAQGIDQQYNAARAGYGVQGERMAQAGLTGSGMSDYADNAAYAARQQAMTAAGSAYDSALMAARGEYEIYRQQVAEKRQANLEKVINNGISAYMSEAVFRNHAEKVGIPLDQIDSAWETVVASRGGGAGTDGEYNPYEMENAGNIADAMEKAIAEGATVNGYLARLNGKGFTQREIQAAVEQLHQRTVADISEEMRLGGQISKKILDSYAKDGLLDKEGETTNYDKLLAAAQEKNASLLTGAIREGTAESYEKALAQLGIQVKEGEDLAAAYMEVVDAMHDSGDLSDEQWHEAWCAAIRNDPKFFESTKTAEKVVSLESKLGNEKKKSLLNDLAERMKDVKITKQGEFIVLEYTDANGKKKEEMIEAEDQKKEKKDFEIKKVSGLDPREIERQRKEIEAEIEENGKGWKVENGFLVVISGSEWKIGTNKQTVTYSVCDVGKLIDFFKVLQEKESHG